MVDELLRPIYGFDGYAISNRGRVRNIKRGQCLTACVNKDGVLQVNLSRGGKTYCRLVHRLVFEAFVGPVPPGECVRHKGDKLDNRPDNLESFVRPYPVPQQRGASNTHAVLTDEEVVEMRRQREAGTSYSKLAKYWEVSKSACRDACERRTWKHVP
jgi:hypothetical protein